MLIRTGLGYDLSPQNNNLLLGYGYIYTEPYIAGTDEKTSFHEHRIFQQFITKQNFGRLAIQHRYRFEQRFIEDNFRLRFRYNLGMTVSLFEAKKWYLSAYDELFIHTDNQYFDRNRLYGGIGYRFNKDLRMEVGWLRQRLQSSYRDQGNIFLYFNW